MKIENLFIKQQHGVATTECAALNLQRGYGISGDINAQAGSPRQLLIVSAVTLAHFSLNPGDLGENILVDRDAHFSSGQILQVGPDALIRLTFLCEPCATLEKIQFGLAKKIKDRRGFLGIAVRDGFIKRGDAVHVTTERLPAIPHDVKGRFSEFVQRIPPGRVVRTPSLLLALGVTKGYYRAIPAFLKKASKDLPVHRIVRADGSLMNEYIAKQEQMLLAEGIALSCHRLTGKQYDWEPIKFHELGAF